MVVLRTKIDCLCRQCSTGGVLCEILEFVESYFLERYVLQLLV